MAIKTTAIKKLVKLTKRKRIIQGGTWAGKTYGILPILITIAAKYSGKHITVVAETIPALKGGAMKDFKEIMMLTGRWIQDNWNATDRKYSFVSGSIIEFQSFDSVGKAQAAGKRTHLFINEGVYIPFEIADALMIRTSEIIWIDFNPTREFWAHTEVMPMADAEFLILKYTDNEALPATILNDLKQKIEKAKTSEYWRNWCKVYIDGEIGNLQGAIFDNWKLTDSVPEGAKLLRHGLDFGFSNDPMACISLFEWNENLIIRENFYRTQMGISELVAALKKLERGEVICDSSNPMMIAELKKAGISARACIKGKDSIEYGIEKLNERDILITKDSLNVIKEFRSYIRDPQTNLPIDNYNHAADAIRYAYVSKGSTIKAKGMVV